MFTKIRILFVLVGIFQTSVHAMEPQMNITIIGLGLIGGSMAKDIKQKNLATITACDHNPKSLEFALQNKLIDKAELDIPTAVKGANIIVICVPINSFEFVLDKIKPVLTKDQVITDVSSVKQQIVKQATEILDEKIAQFIPGHPMAGSEKTGVRKAVNNLFEKKKVILTSSEKTNIRAVQTVTQLWENLGAIVKTLKPQEHDSTVAAVSHMPHVVAFALDDMFNRQDHREMRNFTGGGFESMTRIANSPREFWDNIFKANKEAVSHEIDIFKNQLDVIQQEISKM